MSQIRSRVLTLLAGAALGAVAVQTLHAQTKPPVYRISEIEVSDLDGYTKEFAPKAQAMFKAAGAKFLAAGQNVKSFEGDPAKTRVSVQVYESIEKLTAAQSSAEYKELRKIGDKYAKFRTFSVEGLP
jgi:uncharacterized protein (DUF1330 family)